MTDQLIFKFPSNQIYLKEDFYVSPSNQEAFDFINNQNIQSVVFGASSKDHIEHTVSFLNNGK